jgi:hypothetical protein
MADQLHQVLHRCGCAICRQGTSPEVQQQHEAINRVLLTLDERGRRLLAGLLAIQHGRGGIQRVAEITGLSRMTIRRGCHEIEQAGTAGMDRLRRPGGGRRRLEKKARGW